MAIVTNIVPAGYTVVPLSSGRKLVYIDSAEDSLPVVDFWIAEFGVCVDKTKNSKTPDRDLYPLINTDEYGNCPKLWDI